nr:MAG TPA: hypothetical protein [Caudoviricetes sp.]
MTLVSLTKRAKAPESRIKNLEIITNGLSIGTSSYIRR